MLCFWEGVQYDYFKRYVNIVMNKKSVNPDQIAPSVACWSAFMLFDLFYPYEF